MMRHNQLNFHLADFSPFAMRSSKKSLDWLVFNQPNTKVSQQLLKIATTSSVQLRSTHSTNTTHATKFGHIRDEFSWTCQR